MDSWASNLWDAKEVDWSKIVSQYNFHFIGHWRWDFKLLTIGFEAKSFRIATEEYPRISNPIPHHGHDVLPWRGPTASDCDNYRWATYRSSTTCLAPPKLRTKDVSKLTDQISAFHIEPHSEPESRPRIPEPAPQPMNRCSKSWPSSCPPTSIPIVSTVPTVPTVPTFLTIPVVLAASVMNAADVEEFDDFADPSDLPSDNDLMKRICLTTNLMTLTSTEPRQSDGGSTTAPKDSFT